MNVIAELAFQPKFMRGAQICFQAQSVTDIKFVEGQSTEHYASQLVQLLQQSLSRSESLARTPLMEHLKQQADGMPANADPYAATVWQLTGRSLMVMVKTLNLATRIRCILHVCHAH